MSEHPLDRIVTPPHVEVRSPLKAALVISGCILILAVTVAASIMLVWGAIKVMT